jgi:hypothetical protein
MALALAAGWCQRDVLGEGVFQGRQEAAHVRVALSATEVCGKLMEQCGAARRVNGIEALGGNLADLAGRLQVSVGAVPQSQSGSLEHGPALARVTAWDLVRPGSEHLGPLGEEATALLPTVGLLLGTTHLDQSVTSLAVQVIVRDEVHPAGLFLAAVTACDQFAGGATGVGEVVVAAGGGVRLGKPGQDRRPYDRRGGVACAASGLTKSHGVRGVSSARRLEGEVAEDVSAKGEVVDLMCCP